MYAVALTKIIMYFMCVATSDIGDGTAFLHTHIHKRPRTKLARPPPVSWQPVRGHAAATLRAHTKHGALQTHIQLSQRSHTHAHTQHTYKVSLVGGDAHAYMATFKCRSRLCASACACDLFLIIMQMHYTWRPGAHSARRRTALPHSHEIMQLYAQINLLYN